MNGQLNQFGQEIGKILRSAMSNQQNLKLLSQSPYEDIFENGENPQLSNSHENIVTINMQENPDLNFSKNKNFAESENSGLQNQITEKNGFIGLEGQDTGVDSKYRVNDKIDERSDEVFNSIEFSDDRRFLSTIEINDDRYTQITNDDILSTDNSDDINAIEKFQKISDKMVNVFGLYTYIINTYVDPSEICRLKEVELQQKIETENAIQIVTERNEDTQSNTTETLTTKPKSELGKKWSLAARSSGVVPSKSNKEIVKKMSQNKKKNLANKIKSIVFGYKSGVNNTNNNRQINPSMPPLH